MQTSLKKNNTFSERLRYLIEIKGYKNANEFAKGLEYASPEKLYRLIRDPENMPSSEILIDISNKFEDINIGWLITGKGDVFVTPNMTPNMTPNDLVRQTDIGNMRVLAIAVDSSGEEVIKFVPAIAHAGYLSGFQDPEYVASLPAISITGFLPTHGSYRAFEVAGDSMEPVFLPSDRLIGRYIDDFSRIRDNETYILVCSNDGIVVKRLLNRKNHVVCQSDNSVYPPYNIDYADILEVWKVCLVIRQNITANNNVDRLIKELQSEVNKLKKKST